MESGANPKKQKDFQNVVNPPLLIATDPNQLILGIIAIPELHLLIGEYFHCDIYWFVKLI